MGDNLLFETVRFEPKDFRQRRPDGSGDYIWNLQGVKRVLYHLPELLQADTNEPVFIVEGERDADRLSGLGLVATTCSGGATKWHLSDDSVLAERKVVILPDNDDSGRAHAKQVALALADKAAEIRIVELPDLPAKGDVSDWLDNGGSAEALDKLVERTPTYNPQKPKVQRDYSIPYAATDEGLLWFKTTKDGPVPVRLANFTGRTVTDIREDDGLETRHLFEIEAKLGNQTRRFTVPASQFNSLSWVTDKLGAAALVYSGFTVKDHTRVAIQILSGNPSQRICYRHTGWRKVEDEWHYLHADGAIGANGAISTTHIDLPLSLAHYQLPGPPDNDVLIEAIKADVRLLDLASDHITIPLHCGTYRAALGSVDFAIHLAGDTGTFKTEVAALIQQHFGIQLDSRNLPGSWSK